MVIEPAAPQPYVPIDCSLHDRYEAWAVRRTSLHVTWTAGEDTLEAVDVRITDVRVASGAEYLVLSDGTQIRLDHIVAVRPTASR